MNHSLFWELVRKDLVLSRGMMLITLGVGAVGLFLMRQSGLLFYVGSVAVLSCFVIQLIFLVQFGVLAERKERVHHFVLSLPITGWQYTLAKLTSLSIAFLVPYLVIGAAALTLMTLNPPSRGFVPFSVAVLAYFPMYFAVLVSVTTIKGEGFNIAAVIFFNIALNFLIPGLMRIPSVAATMGGTEVVWTSELLLVIAVQLGVGAISVVWMLWRQHTKTDYL